MERRTLTYTDRLEKLRCTPAYRAWSREHWRKHAALVAEAPPRQDELTETEAVCLLEVDP